MWALLHQPLSAEAKNIAGPLWKLVDDFSNFQNIFLLLKDVGYDFFFLLVHFVTFLNDLFQLLKMWKQLVLAIWHLGVNVTVVLIPVLYMLRLTKLETQSFELEHCVGFMCRLQYMGETPTGAALLVPQDMLEFHSTLWIFKFFLGTFI